MMLNIYQSKTQTHNINPVFGELEEVIKRNNGKLPEFQPVEQFRESLKTIAVTLKFDRIITSPNTYIDSNENQIKSKLSDIFSI